LFINVYHLSKGRKVREVEGFKGVKVEGFKGLKVEGFKGLKAKSFVLSFHRSSAFGGVVLFLWLPSKEKATKKKDHRF